LSVATYTVLGAGGRIGRRLVARLRADGHAVHAPARGEPLPRHRLGHVIYAVGVTADFRTRPLEAMQAHVCALMPLLAGTPFESLLYLSSTRVYLGAGHGREDAPVPVCSANASDLYNLSKLAGEAACLHAGRDAVRIARLSNVVIDDDDDDGADFVPTLRREARDGRIVLRADPESAKDYVHVDDVVALLPRIAAGGRERIYNVGSGVQIRHRQWADALRAATGCAVAAAPGAPTLSFPPLDVSRIRTEFGFAPRPVLPPALESPPC
jgi:nucleoside-diphosphate-sugar epimerase